jgi:hypothetical protein
MGDCLDKYGRRLDGGHGPLGRTTVQPEFLDFRWKSFLLESRVRTVAGTLQVISIQGFARPDHGDERPDSWSSTRNFHICWTRVRIMAD